MAAGERNPLSLADAGAGRAEWFYGEHTDPVFDGMVKGFSQFNECLLALNQHLQSWMESVEEFATAVQQLSDSTAASFAARSRERQIAADGLRWQQAANQIARGDTSQSAISRLRRNLELNIVTPIKEHLDFNQKLFKEMEMRSRRLEELRSAKRQIDACIDARLDNEDNRYLMAQAEFEHSQKSFRKVDRHVFEWLYALEEHRGDILDSSLQTLKYLQYEFFAQSAHALGHTLPARLDFKPMSDMDPRHFEKEVDRCKQERAAGRAAWVVPSDGGRTPAQRFAELVIERQAEEAQADEAMCIVDVLSLCSLMTQGFEEAPARQALRLHGNDTQAALEWLLERNVAGGGPAGEDVGFRRPTARRRKAENSEPTALEREPCEPRAADIGAR